MPAVQAESNRKNGAHLTVCLTSSSPHISLSASPSDPVLFLTVHAQQSTTNDDARPITLCTGGSVLDHGHHARHDGVFRGAFLPLISTADPLRKIQLHFSGWPNYASLPHDASMNLRERESLRFETIPGRGEGELAVTHEISLRRLFQARFLKKEAVEVGEKFRVRMNPRYLTGPELWWAWGSLEGGLKDKKFVRWERPDEKKGEIGNLMPGEKMPDVERMEREGWVFSECFDDLTVSGAGEGEEVIVEFVE